MYVYYEFLGAVAVIVQLHFFKTQISAAAAKTWKIVWRHCQMNGCFKTLQQLQKHILDAHVVIAPSRSVKLETTQTSALNCCQEMDKCAQSLSDEWMPQGLEAQKCIALLLDRWL